MHDTLAIGIPVLAILFGLLLNQRGLDKLKVKVDKLETRMDVRFNLVNGRLDRMQADLSMFYKTLSEHGADFEILKKKMNR